MGKKKILTGQVWTGFITECESRCPLYIIPKPGADGIFICDVLKKAGFFGKHVKIIIEGIKCGKK